MRDFLSGGDDYVAVIHCKAGKVWFLGMVVGEVFVYVVVLTFFFFFFFRDEQGS